MPYCSTNDLYRMAGINNTVISAADAAEFILDAEVEVDRITFTTYWAKEEEEDVVSATDDTVTVSGTPFASDDYVGDWVWVYSGTGANQVKKIESHTDAVITVEEDWDTNPDNTSKIRVIHAGHDIFKIDTKVGNGKPKDFSERWPIRFLTSVTVDDVTVTTSAVIISSSGGLTLGTDAEVTSWRTQLDPLNSVQYAYGVYPVPREVKTLTAIKSAILALGAQMGGTYNVPSTYTLPEGSVTVGQAYINIAETIKKLEAREKDLIKRIRKYSRVL